MLREEIERVQKDAGGTDTAEVVRELEAQIEAQQELDPDDPEAEPVRPPQEEDAWFAAFAPADNPRYAIAVMIVNADGGGGAVAAPIARNVLAAALDPATAPTTEPNQVPEAAPTATAG